MGIVRDIQYPKPVAIPAIIPTHTAKLNVLTQYNQPLRQKSLEVTAKAISLNIHGARSIKAVMNHCIRLHGICKEFHTKKQNKN